LAKLTDGPDEEAVAQAEADVEIAAYNLEIAQENLEGATAVAPMDGTVMSISAQVGETASGGFITIADLSIPKLEIYLDETDLTMVGVGYEVEVVFDALAEQIFIGYVTSVDPGLTAQGNMNVVRAEVELDTSTFSKPQTFPLGLSASVEVIGSQAENAILVPVEALRELGEGEYAVFVMENGEPVLRMVEVGIMDYTYAQILSGVEENEIVTTGIVETE
jgi:RND family efflux transporter MFP subunit